MGGGTAGVIDCARLLRFYSPIKSLLIESMSGARMISYKYIFNLSLVWTAPAIEIKTLIQFQHESKWNCTVTLLITIFQKWDGIAVALTACQDSLGYKIAQGIKPAFSRYFLRAWTGG